MRYHAPDDPVIWDDLRAELDDLANCPNDDHISELFEAKEAHYDDIGELNRLVMDLTMRVRALESKLGESVA